MPHYPKPFFKKARGVWFVEIDRRQINLGPDRDEAFRQYHQLMAQPRAQKVASASLAAVIDAFLEWTQKNRAPDTYEWYRHRLQQFIQQYPDLRAEAVRPFHVETWAANHGRSPTTRRNSMRCVKRCLKWAKRQGYLDRNPVEDLELPRALHREVSITQAEFERLLSFATNEALADLIQVTWETGCRPQESLRVEARHVDAAHQRWVFPRSESKMKRVARVIYLTDRAMEITRRRMIEFSEGPLFRNRDGKPWTTNAVKCGFQSIRKRMGRAEMKRRGETISKEQVAEFLPQLQPTKQSGGRQVAKSLTDLRTEAKQKLIERRAYELVPGYSLYALRHAWATNALQKGLDPLTVAILMGHEDPSMLSRVYQHLSLDPAHMLSQAKRAAP